MGSQGIATINFGSFPGTPFATIDITGQTLIPSNAIVEAWVLPAATADHSTGEHITDPPRVVAGSVIAATGFTIYGVNQSGGDNLCYGAWNVAWVWDAGSTGGSPTRELLTANRTYYVRADGNDSNTGLVNSPSGAFLTLQHAYDVIVTLLDVAGFQVTIQCGTITTFTAGIAASSSWVGGGAVVLDLNTGSIAVSSGNCITVTCPVLSGVLYIQNGTLSNSGGGDAIYHQAVGQIICQSNVTFGAVGGVHLDISGPGTKLVMAAAYTISGGAAAHIVANGGARVDVNNITITFSGTPAFGTAYAVTFVHGIIYAQSATWVGTATGPRFSIAYGSIIYVNGAATTYLPGNAVGTISQGGVYG